MFFLKYAFSELRRRRGRTLLTALGLAVGVGLVVIVSGLTTGLNNAQAKVLEPLTGVGTDMSVTRPLKINTSSGNPFASLSPAERAQLRKEGGPGPGFAFGNAKPGSKIDTDSFQPAGDLTFSESELARLGRLTNVQTVAGSLTLTDVHISGTVPKINIHQTFTPGSLHHVRIPPTGAGPGEFPTGRNSGGGEFSYRTHGSFSRASGTLGGGSFSSASRTITGVEQTKPALAEVTPSQIVKGGYFTKAGDAYEAIASQGYANSEHLKVGSRLTIDKQSFDVIGIASSPLGGTASDLYVKLATLQKLAGYAGQIDTAEVQALNASDVDAVSRSISRSFSHSQVTTAADLASRVSGSLTTAKNLAHELGGALEAVGLVAAVLIASLLMLASVARRVREIGTLKAVGWSRFEVVRQISSEALGQGFLGAIIGVAIGALGIALLNAIGWTLKADVKPAGSQGGGPLGGPGFFGQASSTITSGSSVVKVTAVASIELVLAAAVLALIASLIAGMLASLRAARLRPAAALRTIE